MRFASPGFLAAAAAALALAGCDSAREIEERSDAAQCARCHGNPPPPGIITAATDHPQPPQSDACWACHRTTVSPDGTIGAAHMNGEVDLAAHPVPYGQHPVEALVGFTSCRTCHGENFEIPWGEPARSCNGCHGDMTFADWRTNCTFCHGTRTSGWAPSSVPANAALAAPPDALPRLVDGVVVHEDDPAFRGVGAHQRHLLGGAIGNPVACTECHPDRAGSDPFTDAAHMDGDGVAEVAFGTLATTGGATVGWDGTTCATYCHGSSMPPSDPARPAVTWAPPAALGCGSCHQANPTTGRHPAVVAQHSFACSVCHGGTYTATSADKAFHVNGTVDKNVGTTGWDATDPANPTCTTACHTLVPQTQRWNP